MGILALQQALAHHPGNYAIFQISQVFAYFVGNGFEGLKIDTRFQNEGM